MLATAPATLAIPDSFEDQQRFRIHEEILHVYRRRAKVPAFLLTAAAEEGHPGIAWVLCLSFVRSENEIAFQRLASSGDVFNVTYPFRTRERALEIGFMYAEPLVRWKGFDTGDRRHFDINILKH